MGQELNRREKKLTGRYLFFLSVGSLLLYGLFGVLVYRYVLQTSPWEAFEQGLTWEVQLLIGMGGGVAGAGIVYHFIRKPPVRGVLDDFHIVRLLSTMEMGWFDRIQISLFAGIGEEFLFRGALQSWVGIWIASIIFVGLHGYFRFKSFGHVLFGLIFYALSLMLGWLFEYVGLLAAMSAHAVYDLLMLAWLQKK